MNGLDESAREEQWLFLSGLRVLNVRAHAHLARALMIGCFALSIYAIFIGASTGWIVGSMIGAVLFAYGIKNAKAYAREEAIKFLAAVREAEANGLKLNETMQELIRKIHKLIKD